MLVRHASWFELVTCWSLAGLRPDQTKPVTMFQNIPNSAGLFNRVINHSLFCPYFTQPKHHHQYFHLHHHHHSIGIKHTYTISNYFELSGKPFMERDLKVIEMTHVSDADQLTRTVHFPPRTTHTFIQSVVCFKQAGQ